MKQLRTYRCFLFQFVLLALSLPTSSAAEHFRFKKYEKQSDSWFSSDEALAIADNLLKSQQPTGSWPKNVDTSLPISKQSIVRGTFDNGATCGELRFLGYVYQQSQHQKYRNAFLKGVDHILAAQYANGGWPQFSPPVGYAKHITFNDSTMVNIMNFIRDLTTDPHFDFIGADRQTRLNQAFDRGIDCILRCQIRVDGELTAWCAQHDSVTFEPRPARTYEHPSISGSESVQIVVLLMSLDHPGPEIKKSIESACRWFDHSKLTDIRQVKVDGDKQIVSDTNAPPLWARFYEIGTNRPIFSGRDGVIKYSLAEIEPERRNGYSWYTSAASELPQRLIEWQKRTAKN